LAQLLLELQAQRPELVAAVCNSVPQLTKSSVARYWQHGLFRAPREQLRDD
jgi:hypothetical protein